MKVSKLYLWQSTLTAMKCCSSILWTPSFSCKSKQTNQQTHKICLLWKRVWKELFNVLDIAQSDECLTLSRWKKKKIMTCLKNKTHTFICLMSLFFSLLCLYHYSFSVTLFFQVLLCSLLNICPLQYFFAACIECGSYHETHSCEGTDMAAQSNYNFCWVFELQAQLIIFVHTTARAWSVFIQ